VYNFLRTEGPLYILDVGFQVTVTYPVYVDGTFARVTLPQSIPNYPFYVFWIALAGNIYFIIKLQRSEETKSKP